MLRFTIHWMLDVSGVHRGSAKNRLPNIAIPPGFPAIIPDNVRFFSVLYRAFSVLWLSFSGPLVRLFCPFALNDGTHEPHETFNHG